MRWPPPADWPMADHSRQVLCRPHRWHVQEAGTGPTLLLLHGAGGATQSFRGLFPRLAADHHVVAVDLPGQGFSQMGARSRCGLDPMAADLLTLCRQIGLRPAAVIGHSAGAALALRLAELGGVPGGRIVGINAALAEFKGVAGWLFPMLARALAIAPFSANLFTASASDTTVRRLIEGTGSQLDEAGVRLYLRLASDPGHVDGTLAMMAQWQLAGLLSRLGRLEHRVHLLAGGNDRAVPPSISRQAAAAIPRASVTDLPGLGHLAHEEDPAHVAEAIRTALA